MTSLETHLERMKLEIKVIIDIKICYLNLMKDLNLVKVSTLIYILKLSNQDYKKNTKAKL